ncbi:MAG: hypothetical protein OFPII_25700 [Osedax symbiont Rs1]|nr:MAG: hypothetical protein OFPII_25700 [Osedax symbiont Rs1]
MQKIMMVSKKLVKKILDSPFLITGLGVLIAQSISVVSMPLIAVVSGPKAFGEFNYFLAILAILGVLCTLKIEYSVFSQKKSSNKYHYPVACILVISLGMLAALLLLQFSDWDVLTVSLLLASMFSVFSFDYFIQFHVKNGLFTKNSAMRIFRAVFLLSSVLLLYFAFGLDLQLLLISFLLSHYLSVLICCYAEISKQCTAFYFMRKKLVLMLTILIRAKNTILYLTPAHLLNRYSLGMIILLSGFLENISTIEIAFYALAFKLIISPANIVVVSLSDIIKKYAFDSPKYAIEKYLSFMKINSILLVFFFIALLILPETVIVYFFGNEWLGLKSYLLAVFPYLIGLLLFAPITQIFLVFEKQKLDFYMQIFSSILLTISFLLGAKLSFLLAVFIYSMVYLSTTIVSFIICYSILKSECHK